MKATIDINLKNLVYNFEKLKKSTNAEVIPVVKANAYNIGVHNVVGALKSPKKYFVFALAEGIELRKLFPKLEKIFILGGIFRGDENYFNEYDLTPVVNNLEQLKLCADCGISEAVLQFDTGMNRSGIPMSDVENIKKLASARKIKILMVMSHLCFASNIAKPINYIQIENFKKITANFPEKEISKSLSASDGIYGFELDYLCDSCRPGLILYGYYDGFKPICSISSTVEWEGENLFLPMGIQNGLLSEYGKSGNYVLVDGKKIHIKSVSKNKIILDSGDKDLARREAIILGDGISMKTFEQMCGTDIRDAIARIIANYDVDPDNFQINIPRQKRLKIDAPIKAYVTKNEKGEYMEFISTILEKREVERDGIVGYCATENVKKGDRLATVFGGYLDGIHRGISGKKCHVFVENKNKKLIPCEIFGRVSMDQTIIKIPPKEFDNIKIGAKVIIFDKAHSPDRLAEATRKTKEELLFYLDKNCRIFVNNY